MKGLACFLFCVFAGVWSQAQEAPEEAEEETSDPIQLRFLGYGDSFFEGIFFVNPETEEEITVSFLPDQKSRSYRVSEEMDMVELFKTETGPDGKPVRALQARERLLSGASRQLLVVLENEPGEGGSSLPFHVIVLDESPEAFGPGSVRFFNLSGAELRGRFGGADFVLPDEAVRELVEPADPDRAERLQFWTPTSAGERLVFSSRLKPDANYGKLLVIKPPISADSLRVRVENLW